MRTLKDVLKELDTLQQQDMAMVEYADGDYNEGYAHGRVDMAEIIKGLIQRLLDNHYS